MRSLEKRYFIKKIKSINKQLRFHKMLYKQLKKPMNVQKSITVKRVLSTNESSILKQLKNGLKRFLNSKACTRAHSNFLKILVTTPRYSLKPNRTLTPNRGIQLRTDTVRNSYRHNFTKLFNLYSTFFLYISRIVLSPSSRPGPVSGITSKKLTSIRAAPFPKALPTYRLMFNFKKHYLFVTLLNSKKKNNIFFSLNTGLFLKFYNYKKSLKKSKSLKLVLMRYLRKLLIVTRINNFQLCVKQTSDHLNKLIQTLQKQLNHVFIDPLTGKTVDEERQKTPHIFFNFVYIVFFKNQPYGKMKIKNSGRLKRKIRRRVMKINRIID